MNAYEEMVLIGKLKWKPKGKPETTLADMDLGHLRNLIPFIKGLETRWSERAAAAASWGDENGADQAMTEAFDRMHRWSDYGAAVEHYVALREDFGFIMEGPK